MRAFRNQNARDLGHALELLGEARRAGRRAVVAGGGSDLLGLIKERLLEPDLLVSLRTVGGLDQVRTAGDGVRIGGLITLDALARDERVRRDHTALAEAAASVATPQIRNAATLAGNVCQRPWCWYFRGGFPCFKNGGTVCFAVTGQNQHHAIFGGGPSYIVHPSDTAPALQALGARFRLVSPAGERTLAAEDFFTLPAVSPERENALRQDELLAEVLLPPRRDGVRSSYFKVLDREAWTHAVVSVAAVLELEGERVRAARLVLGGVAPVPWRVARAERVLEGQPLTEALAAKAAATAVFGAVPLQHNAYKVPLLRAAVERSLLELAGRRA